MARRAKRLFTIGYEQTPSKAVLDELQQTGVRLLVDGHPVPLPQGEPGRTVRFKVGAADAAPRSN